MKPLPPPLFHKAITNRKTLTICERSHDQKHSVKKLYSNPSKIVGGSYEKWNKQKHEAPLFHDAATNRKTLPICNRSHDEKHSVKIFFESVKKCGRNCVQQKWTEI